VKLEDGIHGSAVFSDDGKYRYVLTRDWGAAPGRLAVFVGLNPSVADARQDDRTVQKCWRWARKWSYSSFVMLNVYAFRATDPKRLGTVSDSVGLYNDVFLSAYASAASFVVAAWGNGVGDKERLLEVREILVSSSTGPLHCLGVTANGNPRHPLYLPADTAPIQWL
jgi:hypothetical protein